MLAEYTTRNGNTKVAGFPKPAHAARQETPEERMHDELAWARRNLFLAYPKLWLFQFMSGLPVVGSHIIWLSSSTRMIVNMLVLIGSVALSATVYSIEGGWFVFLPSLAVVAAARWAQLVTVHIAAHAKPRQRMLLAAGHALSALLLIEPFACRGLGYAPKHNKDHHSPIKLATPSDPTYRFLTDYMGIRPGSPVRQNAWRLALNMLSAWTHGRVLIDRIKVNLTGSKFTQVSTILQLCIWASLIVAGAGQVLMVAWILPITLGFQLAQMLRLPIEHRWRPADKDTYKPHALRRALTPVNHLTESSLSEGANLTQRCTHCLRQALNLLLRIIVFPRDSSWGHAAHHERAFDIADGERAAYDFRCQLIAMGKPVNPVNWGYCAALLSFLRSVKSAAPAQKELDDG